MVIAKTILVVFIFWCLVPSLSNARYYDPNTGRYLTADPIGQQGGVNLYPYVESNPVRYTDRLGLHHDGQGCVDGVGNRIPCPRDICVTGDCSAGVLPNPPQDPCLNCRADCAVEFLNPIPGIGIERSAHYAGGGIGAMASELARDAAKKANKAAGGYRLGECMNDCKKICNPPQCDTP